MRITLCGTLVGFLVLLAPLGAMEITAFDGLSQADQSRYMVTLLEGSRGLLQKQGKQDMAAKIIAVFDTRQPGETAPIGMVQFEKDLVAARQYRQKTGKAMHVEHALLLTFSKFKIEVPQADLMKLGAGFKPAPAR